MPKNNTSKQLAPKRPRKAQPSKSQSKDDAGSSEFKQQERVADALRELLCDPKADSTRVSIVTGALVELSNELGIGLAHPDIAWNLYHAAMERYDALLTRDFLWSKRSVTFWKL